MERDKVKAAIMEAKRFVNKATELLKAKETSGGCRCPKESGAARRSSLDLTRSLAEMRRP